MKIHLVALILCTSLGALATDPEPAKPSDFQPQVIEQEEVIDDLKKEQSSAESETIEAKKRAESAKKDAEKAGSEAEKLFAAYLSSLENYRAQLALVKLGKVKDVDNKIDIIKDQTEKLRVYESQYKSKPDQLSVNDLNEVTQIWRQIVDETISSIFNSNHIELNQAPTPPDGIAQSRGKYPELEAKLDAVKNEANIEKNELEQIVARLTQSEKDVRSRLLLNSGRVRADLMGLMINKNKFSVWSMDSENIEDLLREMKVVPYRFVATFFRKFFDFKSLSQSGAQGWVEVGKQLFLLLFVFSLPFILFRAFQAFSTYLDNFRRDVFTRSQMDFKKRTKVALWISRVNPYLPWFFAYLAIILTENMLADTIVAPLTMVLPYFSIYVGYRVFRMVFSGLLGRVLLSRNLDRVRTKEPKVKETSKKLSVILFTEFALLHATEDAVRQALIYNMVFHLVVYFNVIIASVEARKWKTELLDLSKQWLHAKVHERLTALDNLVAELIVFPILFAGNIGYLALTWVYQWLAQFEVGKRISSEIFKKRLEDATEGKEASQKVLPQEYSHYFADDFVIENSKQVQLSRSPLKKCQGAVEKWLEGKSHEDLFLIYGNYGIGKSTLLRSFAEKMTDKLDVKKIQIVEKVTTPKKLLEIVSELLGHPIHSPDDLELLDGSLEKTLVIIDDIHNLYLNETHGLGAYRTLIDLTSLQLENVFWCLASNERSFAHLNGLFGQNHFIGEHLELLSWTDAEIQDMIVKRHNQSSYKLKFDRVISAVQKGDILEASSGPEVQFFRLLWGQSRGNPKTAQALWLTAAQLKGSSTVNISVPEFTNTRSLADFSDEVLMALAAIVKHENLSFDELSRVCELPVSTLKQALKLGEDGLILQNFTGDRWRLHAKSQYVVHAQLAGRNLIYG